MSTLLPQHGPTPAPNVVVPVKFKKPGRKRKELPQPPPNVVPADQSPTPEPEKKKWRNLQMIYTFIEENGQPVRKPTGIYEVPGEYGFYIRPYFNGVQRKKKLEVPFIEDRQRALNRAIAKAEEFWEDMRLFKRGKIQESPLEISIEKSLVELCKGFRRAGYPGKNGYPKDPTFIERQVKNIEKWPRSRRGWKEFTLEDCERYREWRVNHMCKVGKGGDRSVDLELVTLSNIFLWALRNRSKTGVTYNPFGTDRPRFRKSSEVQHCREFMPRNADEWHALARAAFTNTKTESIGWAILFQPMIKHRINEVLKLRTDAKDASTPGFCDGRTLFLHRSEGHKGAYGHVDLFPELQAALAAHAIWHRRRYPKGSPWFFPGRTPTEPLGHTAVTKALYRLAVMCEQPKRTSHGLRAYGVNVLRSEGKTDDQLALLVGQKTGGKLIVQVYGEGLPYKIGWMPKDIAPAWDRFLSTPQKTGVLAEQTKMDLK